MVITYDHGTSMCDDREDDVCLKESKVGFANAKIVNFAALEHSRSHCGAVTGPSMHLRA